MVPKNEARPFAVFRGQRWQQEHQQYIDEHMKGRCEVIPYAGIVQETDHALRVGAIREIYSRGNNPVTAWFDASIKGDIETRAGRKEKDGITIEPWAIRESALDYLCDEYAMRSLMWARFGLPEIYVDLAVYEPNLFQRENTLYRELDLTIPAVRQIQLVDVEMVHEKRLGKAFPANDVRLPSHAALPIRVKSSFSSEF